MNCLDRRFPRRTEGDHAGMRSLLVCACSAALLPAAEPAELACTIAPPPHVSTAEFSFWSPPATATLRAVAVLSPGHNGDGRGAVRDPVWRDFAVRHGLALVGVRFVSAKRDDKREAYSSAYAGSGQALLDALASFASQSGRPEVATAPLVLWGHSAGGQFSYEFTCWQPERVAAFVANKGGYYSTHLAPRAAQLTPGIVFVGEKDDGYRTKSLLGIYACNRYAGALWTLAIEPDAGHGVGGTRDLALRFFDAVLPLRLPAAGGGLRPLDGAAGWRGHHPTGAVWAGGDPPPAGVGEKDADAVVWLPDQGFATAWAAFVQPRPAP